MIEEELILELKKNLPKMFKVLGKLAKLDVCLAYIDFIRTHDHINFTKPVLI